MTVLAAVALTGCGASFGTFASTGGVLGAWSQTSRYCASSVESTLGGTRTTVIFADNHRQFFSLATGSDASADVVDISTMDPVRSLAVRRDACTRFEVRHLVQPNGSIGADIELDCDAGDGSRITASLHAQSCR